MEEKEIYKSLKNIETMCEVLVRGNKKKSEIPTIPLNGLLATLESYEMHSGIMCDSKDCVFNNAVRCGIKTVVLKKGRCTNYSPNFKQEDIFHMELIFSKCEG